MKLIKNLIQKLISEEKKFCFEMHNMLSWYFSIEHPAPQPSSRGKNPFFEKYGFLILKDIDKRGVEHEKVLEFLNDIIENKNYKIIFGKKKLYFSGCLRFINLDDGDFVVFDPNKTDFLK
jgi:hypothetical protein